MKMDSHLQQPLLRSVTPLRAPKGYPAMQTSAPERRALSKAVILLRDGGNSFLRNKDYKRALRIATPKLRFSSVPGLR